MFFEGGFMRSLFKKILLLTLLFFSAPLLAISDSETLATLLKNMHSMQADFSQVIINKNGKTLQKSAGRMYLQRPSQFRWEVSSPNRQLIIANGKRLWIYDPDLEQVTIRSLVKAAGETPALLLSDEDLSIGKEFTVTKMKDSTFILIPRTEGSMISRLKLGFVNNQIQEMQLQDHIGHTTNIHFTHAKFNSSLASSLFTFKPPANVDVIDETKR